MEKFNLKSRLRYLWFAFKYIFTGKLPIKLFKHQGTITELCMVSAIDAEGLIKDQLRNMQFELILNVMDELPWLIKRRKDKEFNNEIFEINLPVYIFEGIKHK